MSAQQPVDYQQRRIALDAAPRRIIPMRPDRRYLLLQNIGSAAVSFALADSGADAVAGRGLLLKPGDSFELRKISDADPAPRNAVWASGAGGVLAVLEG